MPSLPPQLLAVRHIGPRRAARLVDGLGADWLVLADADPRRVFRTLRGLGPRRATEAAVSWQRQRRAGSTPARDRAARD